MPRVCAHPGCPTITTRRRCPQHTRQLEQARGTRQQRGYDAAYDQARATWAPLVATGRIPCRRCGQPITGPFDLGHPDRECPTPMAPEHPTCNRAAGGRAAHQTPPTAAHTVLTKGGE